MKKFLLVFLIVIMTFSLCIPIFASNDTKGETYTVIVNNKIIDFENLSITVYKEGDTIMVPLRKIGEALGYKVGWNSETGEITVDDEYIQKATLFDGKTTVIFKGRLKVINMSREIKNAVPTVICNGCTYVPLDFFKEFFNDTVIERNSIIIMQSKSELHANIQ